MRNLIAAALSMTLVASAALASGTTPLAPGKPAGVKQAQSGDNTTALIVIAGIVAIGVAIGLSTSSDGNPGGPVTLTTVPATSTG
jgi:hypothetical protein